MLALVVLEGIVILLLAVLVAGLLRSHAEILRRLEALGAGEEMAAVPRRSAGGGSTPVPVATIAGTTPSGGAVSVSLEGTRGLTLLAFLSSSCTTCRPFWDQFREGVEMPWPEMRPVVVARGDEVAQLAGQAVTTVLSPEAWDAFRVTATPYFVLVDNASGEVIGEGSAGSWPRVLDLIRRALQNAEPRVGGGDSSRPGPTVQRIGLSTRERLRDSDEELRRAGIGPGDESLRRKPEAAE